LEPYLKGNGIQNPKAAEEIREGLEQTNLPGFGRSYAADAAAGQAGDVQRQGAQANEIARAQVLKTPTDIAGLKRAFATGDTISSLLPKYIGGRIPNFDLRGKVVRSPADFAKLAWAFRSPYVETLKVAVLNNRLKKEIGDFHP
jgi:hypothetical protein